MRIISWNVNGLRANTKKGGFDWLLGQSPDIFCLQETKAHPDQLDEEVRNPQGYYAYFDHSKLRKGYSGVAIYSKTKPNNVEYELGIPELDQEGRYLAAQYDDFTLINLYFPNGGGGPERLKFKLAFYDAFLKKILNLRKAGHKVIFCGDVNTAHTAVDLARPKENENNTGFLQIERDWIDSVVANNYIDTFRLKYPNAKEVYTYWDMKTFARERNVGWRIDYFFADKSLKDNIKDVITHAEITGSDHCPLELILRF